jgi:GTP-binding protein
MYPMKPQKGPKGPKGGVVKVKVPDKKIKVGPPAQRNDYDEPIGADAEFAALLKEHRKNKSKKKLIPMLEDAISQWRDGCSSDSLEVLKSGTTSQGTITANIMMTRSTQVMRTILRMNSSELLPEAFPYWEESAIWEARQFETDGSTEEDTSTNTSVNITGSSSNSTILVGTTIAAVKTFSKAGKMDLVERAAGVVGVSLGRYSSSTDSANTPLYRNIASAAATSSCPININILSEMCFGFVSIGAYPKALSCLETICTLQEELLESSFNGIAQFDSIGLTTEQSRKLLRAFLEHTTLTSIRTAFALLITIADNDRYTRRIPSSSASSTSSSSTGAGGLSSSLSPLSSIMTNYIDTDHSHLQLVSNTFMKSVDFVTGAVSMGTLPAQTEGCNEAAFIGRSNVGKSSLINMICNRKGLAYTSKTPGKTSEFNYFDARGRVGVDNELHRFYLVDLPGVGYAEKSRDLRSSWTDLLKSYVTNRQHLRAVFHLVDSRHGLLAADVECLELLRDLPPHVEYVIVLTKVDKLKGSAITRAKVKQPSGVLGADNSRQGGSSYHADMVDEIYRQVGMRTDRVVQLVFTSSETRHGSSQLWSVLLDALARKVDVGSDVATDVVTDEATSIALETALGTERVTLDTMTQR